MTLTQEQIEKSHGLVTIYKLSYDVGHPKTYQLCVETHYISAIREHSSLVDANLPQKWHFMTIRNKRGGERCIKDDDLYNIHRDYNIMSGKIGFIYYALGGFSDKDLQTFLEETSKIIQGELFIKIREMFYCANLATEIEQVGKNGYFSKKYAQLKENEDTNGPIIEVHGIG